MLELVLITFTILTRLPSILAPALQAYRGLRRRKQLHHYDSANHSDDNDAEVVPLASSKKGGASLAAFQIQQSHPAAGDASWRV